jgi:hypothetical protein
MKAERGGFDSFDVLSAAYSHIGNNFRFVLGDLTGLTYDDEGIFLNLVA